MTEAGAVKLIELLYDIAEHGDAYSKLKAREALQLLGEIP